MSNKGPRGPVTEMAGCAGAMFAIVVGLLFWVFIAFLFVAIFL